MLRNIRVLSIPVLTDNYAYILIDTLTKEAACVDPVEPKKVVGVAEKEGLRLTSVLTTHHHWDHASGNEEMVKLCPNIKVYGGDKRIPSLHHFLNDNETVQVGGISVRAIYTPCHTLGSNSFYCTAGDDKVLFTGDTLFIAGCGRFFEGEAKDMESSLNRLKQLPKETLVYCGHEYTQANLAFALRVEPDNCEARKLAENLKQVNVPSTIGQELLINPFMRTDVSSLLSRFNESAPDCLMAKLREMKNNFN